MKKYLKVKNTLEDSGSMFTDLSNILDAERLNDGQTSENLRDFYKKLIQTDTKIKNLKKGIVDYTLINGLTEKFKNIPTRSKRWIRIKHIGGKKDRKDNNKLNNVELDSSKLSAKNNATKYKRFANGTLLPAGFIIEKEQIIVQYNPDDLYQRRKFPKCSHVPNTKSHEKQLKHPFYKNTQRLDELLDQFVDKSAPNVADNINSDGLFNTNKEKCKHPKIDDKIYEFDYNAFFNKEKHDNVGAEREGDFKSVDKPDKIVFDSMDNKDVNDDINKFVYDILKNTTLKTPEVKNLIPSKTLIERSPSLRKLMQILEEDEEELGYEDLKEVLTDNGESHDETDRQVDRNKRMDETKIETNNPVKFNPPGVHNPNWKGPMPLYPDELNSMIKQAVLQNFNRVAIPMNNKDTSSEADISEEVESDVQYIQDYLENKNDKLVNMAQAYSDYGVLDGKKETVHEKSQELEDKMINDERIKLSAKKTYFRAGLFGRNKKGTKSEGLKFEIRPTSEAEPGLAELVKSIHKHVKIVPNQEQAHSAPSTPMTPTSHEYEVLFTPFKNDENYETTTKFGKDYKNGADTNDLLFSVSKIKRSLKSIDIVDDFNEFNISDPGNMNTTDTVPNNTETFAFPINHNGIAKNSKYSKNSTFNEINEKKTVNITEDNNNKSAMGPSDFLLLLANWFHILASMSTNIGASENVSKNLSISKEINKTDNVTEIMYPMYDSDMIDNIGHRSRVLLSVEDKSHKALTGVIVKEEPLSEIREKEQITTINVNINTTEKIITLCENTTKSEGTNLEKVTRQTPNKTIVKRSADDSNLIFWNDIYDDEYGIKVDNFEDSERDTKMFDVAKNQVLKSEKWLQRKVKKLADRLRKDTTADTDSENNKRKSRSISYKLKIDRNINQQQNKLNKRAAINDVKNQGDDSFKSLNANMKEVCKQAAAAVRRTKDIAVPDKNKEGAMATSLMQQLVGLMSELVDFQVEQKTCLKLPEDLQHFLEWLLTSDTEENLISPKHKKLSPNYEKPQKQLRSDIFEEDYYNKKDKSTNNAMDLVTTSSSEKEVQPEARSECLGTLQAIQELIQQYDNMSSEDKSKMTGVREYLENQLDFLNKQLENYEDPSIQNSDNIFRFRRDIINKKKHQTTKRDKLRRYRKKRRNNRFVKSFGKKHTRSTIGGLDFVNTDENKEVPVEKNKDSKEMKNIEDGEQLYKTKRNLKDVYYKALEDAKKMTTVKHLHKKGDFMVAENTEKLDKDLEKID